VEIRIEFNYFEAVLNARIVLKQSDSGVFVQASQERRIDPDGFRGRANSVASTSLRVERSDSSEAVRLGAELDENLPIDSFTSESR